MKQDDWLYIIMAVLIVLLVVKTMAVRAEGQNFAQVLVDKFNNAVDRLLGIQPTTNNYYNEQTSIVESATPNLIKEPSCLVYASNKAYCFHYQEFHSFQ